MKKIKRLIKKVLRKLGIIKEPPRSIKGRLRILEEEALKNKALIKFINERLNELEKERGNG